MSQISYSVVVLCFILFQSGAPDSSFFFSDEYESRQRQQYPAPAPSTALPELTPAPPLLEERAGGNVNSFSDLCPTADGGLGSCVSIKKCPIYYNLLRPPIVTENVRILKSAHCGFENNEPKVCCPLPPIPNQPPQPSTSDPFAATTSTTTEPTTTTVSSQQFNSNNVILKPPYCGVSNASFSRVVGGVNAKLGDFPWMALLGYKGRFSPDPRWLCGGSIISSKHVLTAAHCIHGHEKDLYLVRLGELDISRDDDGATPIDVLIKTKIKHEGYDPKAFVNDIAVLVLERNVQFTPLIQPICIPLDPELRARSFENYTPLIAGWGTTEFRGESATHLQALQLPVTSNAACKQAYIKHKSQVIDERVICAGYTRGKHDACQGDSGGPLMQPVWTPATKTIYFHQIGVISYGYKCAEPGFPGVYTRVTYFVPWLEKTLAANP